MSFQIAFPWSTPTTNSRCMRCRSERVHDPITRQNWYLELQNFACNKTCIRLCLVPSDDLRKSIVMQFSLYLKKGNTILAVTTNVSRFSPTKLKSEICLLNIPFKDINDDVKLSMSFDVPLYSELNDRKRQKLSLVEEIKVSLDRGRNIGSFLSFLKTGKFSDVIIAVEGQEIKCHKTVLSWTSPYFYQMFESGLNESMQNKIDIVDFDYETINTMIDYLYSLHLPKLSLVLLKKLRTAAAKYKFFGLKHNCEDQLISAITKQNAMDILLYADIHSAGIVKDRAINFILSNWKVFKDKDDYEPLMTRPDLLRDLMIAKANEDSESRASLRPTFGMHLL